MEACCENQENRLPPEPVPDKPGLVVSKCIVCDRRHFELTLDPGDLAFELT